MKPPSARWRSGAVEILGALLLWYVSAAGYLLIREGHPGGDSAAAEAARATCYAVPPGVAELRAEWQLVLIAASLAAACLWLCLRIRAPAGRVLLAWAAWEAGQVAVCSIGGWGLVVPLGSGLCFQRYGYAPTLVMVALSLLIVHFKGGGLWQSQKQR